MKYTKKQLLEASKILESIKIAGIDLESDVSLTAVSTFALEEGLLTIEGYVGIVFLIVCKRLEYMEGHLFASIIGIN